MQFEVGSGEWLAVGVSILLWAVGVALVLTLLILAIRWFLRAERTSGAPPASPPWGSSGAGPDPLAILRERYARGEIDDEEFERRRKTLAG